MNRSEQTRRGIAEARAGGVEWGRPGRVLAERNRVAADVFAEAMRPVLVKLMMHDSRQTTRAARELNELGVPTRCGGSWYPVTVRRVVERLGAMTLVEVSPRTGRTHQIRVHLDHIGFPIVKDAQYGRDAQASYANWVQARRSAGARVPIIDRQALHAHRLTVDHPLTGERITYEAPIPADMADLIEVAREGA